MTTEPTNGKAEVPVPAERLFEMPDDSAGFQLAERAIWHLLEKKADQ